MVVSDNGTTATIYTDGVQTGSGSVGVGNSSSPLLVGAGYYGNFNGLIDDVRIFTRALSVEEIRNTMYKSTLSGTEDDNLVGWWKMNDASGQTVADSSGNGNNGTLGANASAGSDDPSWSTDAPVPSISALATGEKIFAGGYKTTSSAADAGIVRGVTGQTAGQNYVVRALANSDGTSIPKVVIWDTTNNAEITSLTGTNTSTRTDPDNLIFTFELPTVARNGVATDSTGFEVRLINTQDSGTTYWHQVEVLPNLIDNPSMETGSGDPWIPDGWTNFALDTGDSSQETSVVHSGSSSVRLNPSAVGGEGLYELSLASGYIMIGSWIRASDSADVTFSEMFPRFRLQSDTVSGPRIKSTGIAEWTHATGVLFWGGGSEVTQPRISRDSHSGGSVYGDDVYSINLNSVSLTVNPASQANSTENTDELRVDGRDTYTASSGEATSIGTSTGYVSFNYRPRHSAADMVKFAETTSDDAYVMSLAGDGDDYVNLYWDSANTLKLEYSMSGTTASSTWDATSAIAANTEYDMALSYTGGSTMTLAVDGTTRITLSGIPSTFGTAPNTVYFGSNSSGANQGDATFSDLIFDSTAPSISLTALSPDPNNDNTPTLSGTATEAIGTVSNVEYQMDGTGGSWSSCTADDGAFDEASEPFSCTTTTLSDGSHTMYVRATDSYSNTTGSGSEVSDTFVVDTTAPELLLTPITPDPTTDYTPSISGTVADATGLLVSVEYQVDSTAGSWNACFADDATFNQATEGFACHMPSLPDGEHTVYVRGTDDAGNVSTPVGDTFTVDTTPLTPTPTPTSTPTPTPTNTPTPTPTNTPTSTPTPTNTPTPTPTNTPTPIPTFIPVVTEAPGSGPTPTGPAGGGVGMAVPTLTPSITPEVPLVPTPGPTATPTPTEPFIREDGYDVALQIKNEDGDAINNAKVSMVREDEGVAGLLWFLLIPKTYAAGEVFESRSDGAGEAAFDNIPGGTYRVTIAYGGFVGEELVKIFGKERLRRIALTVRESGMSRLMWVGIVILTGSVMWFVGRRGKGKASIG